MAYIPLLRTVGHDATRSARTQPVALYIGHISQTPEVPYCYYKLVTNVIRAVKINVVIPMVYGLIYHGFQLIRIQGSNHPVYKSSIFSILMNEDSHHISIGVSNSFYLRGVPMKRQKISDRLVQR